MIPNDQTSTFGPYSFLVTTSGAIQYGVPTIVVRFADAGSVILATNPKSAITISTVPTFLLLGRLTELDIPIQTQEDIITLDIPVYNTFRM